MEEKVEIKKGSVSKDLKRYQTDKKTGELLVSTLSDIKEKFKGSDTDSNQVILSADASFEQYKKAYNESLEIVIPEVEPMAATVITSAKLSNVMEFGKHLIGQEFNINLIKQFKTATSDTQIVLAAGPNCRQVKVGDTVSIRLADFTRRENPNTVNSREVTEIPLEVINGNSYLSIHENNIRYILKDDDYNIRRK